MTYDTHVLCMSCWSGEHITGHEDSDNDRLIKSHTCWYCKAKFQIVLRNVEA